MSPDLRRQSFDPTGGALPEALDPARAEHAAGMVVLAASAELPDREWSGRTAVRLAREWAAAGRRVFLADLSLEEPLLHELLDEANGEGISDAVLYGASVRRIARAPARGGFYFAPAGTVVSDPAEVLEHARWDSLAGGFRGAGATLLLFLPAGLAGARSLLERADHLVLLGADAATGGFEADERALALLDPASDRPDPEAPDLDPEAPDFEPEAPAVEAEGAELEPGDLDLSPEEAEHEELDLVPEDVDPEPADSDPEPADSDPEPEPASPGPEPASLGPEPGVDLGGLDLEIESGFAGSEGSPEPGDLAEGSEASDPHPGDPRDDSGAIDDEAAALGPEAGLLDPGPGADEPVREADEHDPDLPGAEEWDLDVEASPIRGEAEYIEEAGGADTSAAGASALRTPREEAPSHEARGEDALDEDALDEDAAAEAPREGAPDEGPPAGPEPAEADRPEGGPPAPAGAGSDPLFPSASTGRREGARKGAPRRRVELLVLLLILVLGGAVLGWYYGILEIPGIPPADQVVSAFTSFRPPA